MNWTLALSDHDLRAGSTHWVVARRATVVAERPHADRPRWHEEAPVCLHLESPQGIARHALPIVMAWFTAGEARGLAAALILAAEAAEQEGPDAHPQG